MKWGIASRFAVIFSLLVLLATGTVGYMVYQGARRSLIDSATDRLAHTAETIEIRFTASVEAITKDVRFLAAVPPVQGLVRVWTGRRPGIKLDPQTAISDREWRDQFAEILEVFLKNRPSYYRARFINLVDHGRELVRVEKHQAETVRIPTDQLGFFTDSSVVSGVQKLSGDTLYLSDIVLSERGDDVIDQGVPTLQIAIPVRTQYQYLFGAVVIEVDYRNVLESLRELANPDKSLFISNDRGELLVYPQNLVKENDQNRLYIQHIFPQVTSLLTGNVNRLRVENAQMGDSLNVAYFESTTYYGASYHDNLILGVTSPHASILEGVRRVRDRSILITLLFSIGGIVLAMSFSGFLIRPLSQITNALSSFGQESREKELPVNRGDEIGILARAFQTMSEQIQNQLRELEDKEHRQRIILETSVEGIVVVNANGEVETYNKAAERMFSFTSKEVIGKNVGVLLAPVDLTNQPDIHDGQVLEQWKTIGTGQELTGKRKDGTRFPVSLSVSAFDLLGERKYAAFIEDITNRKQYEVALQRAKEQAEEMARLKSAFLANMSHEIRTPLTSVIGYASVLAKEVNEKHRRFAQLIERSGRRLMDTLNSVLALAQLEAKQVEVQFDVIQVVDEVREIVQLYQQLAHQKGLSLSFSILPGSETVRSRLDRGALSSIMQNLIGNAIKFTDAGSIAVVIEARNERVFIRVSDTGVGIDDSFLPHLFEEFRQESTGLSRTHEGSGLGLSITKRLIQLMDGHVSVSTKKGQGSTFTVSFPIDSAFEPPLVKIESEKVKEVLAGLTHSEILLVEDNRDTAYLILHLLLDICDVTLASNGDEAFRKAQRKRFDAVLVDINLGHGENGVDVLARLRTIEGYQDVPIAAVTAYALPGDREQFLSKGFDAYLSKPFTAEGLVGLTARLLPG